MPLEIRELVIKAVVNGNENDPGTGRSQHSGDSNTEAIIRTCVEQVMEIIRREKDR